MSDILSYAIFFITIISLLEGYNTPYVDRSQHLFDENDDYYEGMSAGIITGHMMKHFGDKNENQR